MKRNPKPIKLQMADFEKVFDLFRKNYIEVPLEYFKDHPYKTLISTLMSARTRDEVTLEAAKKLFASAPDFKKLSLLSTEEIEKTIRRIGFSRTKAKHIKELSLMVLNDFKGKVPNTREELMKLPGVGRKTANLVLNRAFHIPAIAVDTHVHRITNMLGWVRTKTPEKTEEALNKLLPQKFWPDMNRLFVSIGRQYTGKKKLEEFLRKNKLIQ